jgi:hypothetical protein
MESIARVASAISATAIRPVSPGGEIGLAVGQTVHARVTRVEGDTVQLRWGDQTLSVASRIPLNVGQQVSLMVEEGGGGKMLLRMVDDTFGKGRPARPDGRGNGRGGGMPAPAGGRPGQVAGVPGWAEPADGASPDDLAFWGSDGDSNGVSGPAGRPLGATPQTRPSGATATIPGARTNGAIPGATATVPGLHTNGAIPGGDGAAGLLPRSTSAAGVIPGNASAAGAVVASGLSGMPVSVDGDPLTTLLFEPLDGTAARLAGSNRPAGADLAPRGSTTGSVTGGLVARAALPTYGKLAQSVSGAAAFGQLMATLGHDVGQTLARAPLAPADLGRLLIDVGVHPDETNAVLVGEMLAQGVAVHEGSVRRLRRGLASAGGSLRDAAPTVALSRLGLPITPLSLAIARQMQAGQLDPKAAWGELLAELQGLARGAAAGSQAGVLASELLADWRVPLEEGADGISRWLRAAVDQAATPLEAKLARSLMAAGDENGPATTPGQDVRARLDLLSQALPTTARVERGPLSQALQRTQATIQAEQILNGASVERADQRFFAVTLPTVMGQQPSTLELRVRERDAHPRAPGEAAQPEIVQMKLSLPGLGDLGVSLMVGQHSVSCHFSAGSSFAEALLSASSSELVGRLKRLGFAHTAVDAAHEAIESTTPPLVATPRVNHVDIKA